MFVFFKKQKEKKRGRRGRLAQEVWISFLERVCLPSLFLLSKFLRDPTVGSRRDKRQSCSTHRVLCVGPSFMGFLQTLRGRGFSLLGFYSLFKSYVNV